MVSRESPETKGTPNKNQTGDIALLRKPSSNSKPCFHEELYVLVLGDRALVLRGRRGWRRREGHISGQLSLHRGKRGLSVLQPGGPPRGAPHFFRDRVSGYRPKRRREVRDRPSCSWCRIHVITILLPVGRFEKIPQEYLLRPRPETHKQFSFCHLRKSSN